MAWKKSSPETVRRFDALARVAGAERGLLFGCPIYTLGEQRYATLYQDRFVLRLAPDDAARLLAKGGERFAPIAGRASKDRVVVPEGIAADTRALKIWLRKAVRFAQAS